MTNKEGNGHYPPVDKLWTAQDVANYLGLEGKLSYQVVERWVREGKLKGGKVGNKHRFRKEDIDNYVFKKL